MTDCVFATTTALAKAIRERRTTSVEVVEAHLAQIARHNPTLNVIITLDAERALTEARAADADLARGVVRGPLHGVPVALDDSFETAGMRTAFGHPPLADYIPNKDATVVARLRAAGAIVLGKTNVSQRGLGFQASNPLFGATNNPWDLTRTSGGHVGGAAAVAAGMTPFTIGSDAGSSLRVPAHFCGVYAMRPTAHRIPRTGQVVQMPG